MIEAIIFSLYTLTFFVLMYLIIKLNIRIKKIMVLYMQSEFDKHLLKQELEKIYKENSNRELLETDGFVKFISQSRDWAFEYIEEVQAALIEFGNEVEPNFEWSKTYGTTHNNNGAHAEILRKISLAYDKLKTVLPKNTETPNN